MNKGNILSKNGCNVVKGRIATFIAVILTRCIDFFCSKYTLKKIVNVEENHDVIKGNRYLIELVCAKPSYLFLTSYVSLRMKETSFSCSCCKEKLFSGDFVVSFVCSPQFPK